MDLNQNHAGIAWGNNLMQFDKAPIMRAFFMAIHKPYDDIQASTRALFDERWLDNATDKQLDGIGQILRQTRYVDFPIAVDYFGFDGQPNIGGFGDYKFKKSTDVLNAENITKLADDEYRKVLYWRIAVLTGSGTAPDIRRALSQILGIHSMRTAPLGNANLKIWLALNSNTNASLLTKIDQWLPIAAGVGFKLSASVGQHTFGFKSQRLSGFGVGTLAKEM